MYKKMFSLFLAFLMGIILPLAFAPFQIFSCAFIIPAVLLYLWKKSTPGAAFWQGAVFGLGFYGVGVSWVYISIHNYGNASIWVAGLITLAMITFLSLGPATQAYLLKRVFGKCKDQWLCLAAFPSTWVIWEWLRSLPLNGFPWLYLGYSQLSTPLRGYAPIIGVFGVSLVAAIISGCLVLISTRRPFRMKLWALLIMVVLVIGGWVLTGRQWTKPVGAPLSVSMVQANISQSVKWKPDAFQKIVQTYWRLTKPYWNTSRLIIWPEAALPAFPQQIPNIIKKIDDAADQHSTILLGILLGDPVTKPYYNGIMLLGADHGEYRKRHLVPFGEYTPLKSIFSFLINYWQIPMSDFNPGSASQSPLIVNGIKIAPFICYEIAYPLEVLKYSRESQILVNISDDSWFGKSIAAPQQAEMARLRALETGRYVLLAANTGITGIIDQQGQFISILQPHQEAVLHSNALAMQGATPLLKWGYYPLLVILVILLALSLFL